MVDETAPPGAPQSAHRTSGENAGRTPRSESSTAAVSTEEAERVAAVARGAARDRSESAAARARLAHDPVGLRAFQVLADTVRDYAIFLLDPTGVIRMWSESARLMKWWTKEEAEGAHLRLLYPDGGSEDGTAEAHVEEAARDGEYTGEGHRVRSDGSTFWAGVTLTALRDDAGTLRGFAKLTRDLTAQRAADELLRSAGEAANEARAAAEAANRAKSGFLATMSHEIRTPVNAILGYQDLLDLEVAGPLTDEQRRYLERARISGRHLLSLIDDILDLSRLEADRLAVAPSPVRIGAVVDAGVSLLRPQAATAGVHIEDAVSGHAAAVACWADEERARQIVVNLLSNAIKFTAPGGRVIVSAGVSDHPVGSRELAGPGPWAYIRVEDNGEGIAPDRIDAVFEPFVQADMSHTRVHGGSGLGLAISRRLARAMGGDIVGRSELGVGSTFFVWLRAAPGASGVAAGLPGASPALAAAADAAGERSMRPRPATPRALRDVAAALLGDIDRILHAYVARLRADPEVPSAARTTEHELEDHLATFLADVAQGVASSDAGDPAPADALRDGAAIQRVVAERHGRQRARLGWTEDEIHREFTILGEELAAAVRRRVGLAAGQSALDDAVGLLREFVGLAERTSVESFRRARDSAGAT